MTSVPTYSNIQLLRNLKKHHVARCIPLRRSNRMSQNYESTSTDKQTVSVSYKNATSQAPSSRATVTISRRNNSHHLSLLQEIYCQVDDDQGQGDLNNLEMLSSYFGVKMAISGAHQSLREQRSPPEHAVCCATPSTTRCYWVHVYFPHLVAVERQRSMQFIEKSKNVNERKVITRETAPSMSSRGAQSA